MAFRRQITGVTIHCDKCDIELARREMIMLAIIPPSHHHLAVRQEKEADAFEKLKKVENTKGGKSAQYCPWIVLCRQCGMHVGKVTLLLSKQFVCYKIENIYLVNNGEEIRAKKLCKIRSRLEEECCIEVVDVSSAICQSQLQPSEPMIYCDTSALTHASPEIDFLTQQCPRDYQRELFLSVMRKNTLVCLPTGSGKTLVAAMALSCMKKLNPNKLMVFLVDRVPLVYQQSEYIRSQVPELRVMTLVGEMESPQQKAVHQALANQKVDVLVLTHQIFLNFLAIEKNPIVRLSDISVLVFDEAHHCRGRHQYNQIMEYYHVTPNKFKPIVLGLTASPAGGVTVERTTDQLKELLDNLSCEVSTPIESNDLAENVNNPDTLYCTVPEMNTRQVVLLRIIQEHIQYLKTSYLDDAHRSQRFAGFPLFSSNFRGAVRRLNDSCHGDKTKTKAVIAGEHIMQMLSIVDVCEVLGCERAMECLRECVHNITHELSPKGSALSKMVREDATFRDLRGLVDISVDEESPISDRYNILVAHIKQFVCQVQQDESSRGIVFVSMRKTAYKLCEQIRMLPEVPETLNPKVFVGHGQGSYDGMAWVDEQEVLLQCFKTGQTKLLISTSVLEEGLDVPECNLVIRFEGAASLRALVQTRGRASRRPGSKFVVICNERQKQEAEDVVLKERNMEEAIRHLMENNRRKLQSEDFGCEVKRLDSFVPTSNETIEITNKKYNPQVSISVHHLGTLEHQQHVVEFLEQKFEVMAMKTNMPSSSGSEGSRRKDLSFDLQPNEDGNCKEFRSKEGFICHVTEEWCSYLTKPEEEPLPVWLKASFTKKRDRAEDTFHSLRANSLFLGTFLTRCHFRYQWPSEPTLNNVLIYFDHSLKILTIGFKTYKLELRYEELEDFIIVNSDVASGVIKLFLTIKHPPRLFQSVDHPFLDVGGDNEQGPHENDDDDFLQVDVDDIGSELSDDGSESESDSFSTDEEYPDPNMKRPLRHEYNFDKIAWERLPDILNSENAWAHCYTYCFVLPCNESSQIIHLLSRIQNRFNKKAFYCRVKESFGRFPVTDIPPNLPYDVKYASQMVISRHPVMRGKMSSTFSELLLNKPTSVVCAALEQLKKALEQDSFCDPEKAFKAFLGQNNPSASGFQNRPIPGHCALIKRAVITPTRLLLYPPEVMVKNRVLRQYETESFLCVSVRDEDLSKLSAGGGSLDPLLDGINRVLDEGLNIAGQRFQFLGSSNSQLRNHSCWFVGPKFEPDIIRRWMGDFSHIKCVASYVARMGQCFSTSIDSVGIGISEGTLSEEEDDVKTVDQKYCFSDGIGRISEELAAEVVRKIAKLFKPSAFQIRFSGCKGVLAVDPRLPGKQAIFRPSMCKFESFHRRLEVLQTSRPQVVYLNHQVIMLLSNQGVPDDVFIRLQSNMLEKLAGMLVNENDAIELLGTGAKTGVSYKSLSSSGIPLTTEPFFKSLLVAMYRNHIHELLSRSRILLPPEEARLMMGVMDELGVLKPGQVYVQYSEVSTRVDHEDQFNMNKKRVVTGPLVVTRNPCLHPGDVRQLEAVDVLELSHIVDCVVFPRRGSRPHSNEMAGGDLDGDLYFVCWNKDLLPRKPNFPPMDYQALDKQEQSEPITAADMTKFVVNYIRCDQLGVIDNAHKALADQENDGVESKVCLHLAEIHSLAVDAPKTGKWPQMQGIGKIKACPDFMMKRDKPSYPSDKVLGKLYRRCRKFQDAASEKFNQKMRIDKFLLLQGYDRYLEEAIESYQQYRDKMQALMSLYGIESEAEVFTGCFLKLRNRLSKEKTEIAENVSRILFEMRSEFRNQFFHDFNVNGQHLLDNKDITDEMLLKASAWYIVAYTHAHDQANESEPSPQKRLLGFPWFVNDIILAIKNRKQPHHFSQSLDVNTTVGESLARLFTEEKTWLLEQFLERVRTKNSIVRHLKGVLPQHSMIVTGSSASLLFHENSDLDICVLPQGTQKLHDVPVTSQEMYHIPPFLSGLLEECSMSQRSFDPIDSDEELADPSKVNDIPVKDQVKSIERLIPHLKETQVQKGEQGDPKNLFHKVGLVGKKTFPVIVCKHPTGRLLNETKCSPNLVCDLIAFPRCLPIGVLLSSYIKSFPHLLLVLRVIHRWCYVTGLSRNKAGAGNTSNVMGSVLLVQCMRKGQIQNFNEDHITSEVRKLVREAMTESDMYVEWEKVIRLLGDDAAENANRTHLPTPKLGEMLMRFFKAHKSFFEEEVPDPLSRILRARKFADLLDKDHLNLVKEHMRRAYQLLALYGDVQIMLAISGSEDYNVIYLSPLLSSFFAGVEKSKALEITRKTGARSVVIRPKLPRSRNSAIVEVKGSEPTIRAVEVELDRMEKQASRDRVSLMSRCFVEDASVVLYEGSRHENDHVSLTPYDGPCHQTHDSLARHVALVTNPTCSEYPRRRFTEKFFQQLKVVERDFDPQIHGRLEFAVHFGRVYMFSVPHVLLEDGEPISIAMLRTNKRKTVKPPRGRHVLPREVSFVDEQEERARRRQRRAKRTVACESNRKKGKRGNPSRSAFYTSVHFPDRVKKFLRERNFFPDNKMIEKYTVDICPSTEDIEFYVRLDNNLRFIDIKFPNLRWCMVDLKRTWKARPNLDLRNDAQAVAGIRYPEGHVTHCNTRANDDIILDGLETDIRFLLHSRYEMSPQDTRDTKYAQYQDVLRRGSQMHSGRPFAVKEDQWKDVRLIRFIKSTKFKRDPAERGFMSKLTVYLDEVTEYSRPSHQVGNFQKQITRWELSIEAALPEDLTEKETVKRFLRELWEYSFSLSSFLSA